MSAVSAMRDAMFAEARRLGLSLTGEAVVGDPWLLLAAAAQKAIEVPMLKEEPASLMPGALYYWRSRRL